MAKNGGKTLLPHQHRKGRGKRKAKRKRKKEKREGRKKSARKNQCDHRKVVPN
jgi:hypothetical protein